MTDFHDWEDLRSESHDRGGRDVVAERARTELWMSASHATPLGDLRVVVCGGGPAGEAIRLVTAAGERGWKVDVTATRNALDFLDVAQMARASGRPVRTTYKFAADGSRISPAADAMIIAPATFNTINKLALGIADTYVLSSMAEVIGRGVPTVVVPAVNPALASRAPFQRAVESLRAEGVHFLFDSTGEFPWSQALDLVEKAALTSADRRGRME
jgi:phosphopantothenoylcysteine synthetase/decarboxylase